MPPAIKDHGIIQQEEFRGLFSRGNNDAVPSTYFLDCLNVKFNNKEVSTRDGLVADYLAANIVRFFEYRKIGETPRYIYLDNNGNLYDSLFPSTPIYQDLAIVDFSMVNMYNRAYITPHNRTEGIPGKSVLVYTGSGTARLAGGLPPSSFTLVAANSVVSGSVEPGDHLFAVAYITDTGFITAPGSSIALLSVPDPGGFKVNLSSIPIGPAGTSQRIILATRAIPDSLFTGNLFGYEFFFIPNGTIGNNTDTTATVDFYDLDLLESADYLFDNLSTIPAGVAILVYNGRLGVVSEDGNNWTIRLSDRLKPETFNGLTGFITVDPSDGTSGLKNAFEYRKNLIITSDDRIYTTTDNDTDPSTWAISIIDKGIGSGCFGVATTLDARGSNTDRVWMATRAGLVSFEGYTKKPELSSSIEDYWKRINKAHFDLVQVVDDPINHRVMISVPLDSATAISHILMGDYKESFTVYNTIDETKIKWTPWTFPSAPKSIIGGRDVTTGKSTILFALTAGIYAMKDGLTDDFGNALDSYVQLSLKTAQKGWICHFGLVRFRITGTGNLQITLTGEDGVSSVSPPSIALSTSPGEEPDRFINFINEKMSMKLRTNLFGEKFTLSRVDVMVKPLWASRPG